MKIIKDKFEYIRHTLTLPLFYQAAWWDALCGENEWIPGLIVDQNSEIIGVWPHKITQKWFFKLLIPIPFTPWSGPWIFPLKNEKEGVRALRERKIWGELSKNISSKASLIVFRWPPNFQNTQVWKENGFYQLTHFTRQFKDIQDSENIRAQFSPTIENDLKAAEKVFLPPNYNANDNEKMLKNQRIFLTQKNVPFHWNIQKFEEIQNNIRSTGGGDIMIEAVDELGNVHGRSWTVMDKQTAWLLFQVSEKEQRHRGTMIWLIWQNILWLKGKVKVFDLEGSMIPAVSKKYESTGASQIPLQLMIGGKFAIFYLVYQFLMKLKKYNQLFFIYINIYFTLIYLV